MMRLPLADPVVDWAALLDVLWVSLLGGVGVTSAYALVILGMTRAVDMRRDGHPAAAGAYVALAALDVLEAAGIDAIHARSAELADRLARALGSRVVPRGRSTLVSWEDSDPEAAVVRVREEGFIIRNLPGSPYLRASVGAWSSEDELDRLAGLA